MKQSIEDGPSWCGPHAGLRTDGYVLLAALLLDKPSEAAITLVQNMSWSADLPDGMREALAALQYAGSNSPLSAISEDFDRLFVGMGCGELIPYASWYREKMIQSAPLAAIRSDLARLGIVRQSDCFEPEDHAGALCEIMALLSLAENEIAAREQAAFFHQHIACWMPILFKDLQRAGKKGFYSCVGDFGCCFLKGESGYLQALLQEDVQETRSVLSE
jgi:TorA maturation chaperone TorD